jgi:hypothetical protein
LRLLLPALLCFAVAVSVAGCGDDSTPSPGRAVDLAITASDGHGTTRRARLLCGDNEQRASGFGSANAAELCQAARRLERFLTTEPDRRRACTQIYGGPESARISGAVDGAEVDRRLSRTDGCRISEWERAAPLIPL